MPGKDSLKPPVVVVAGPTASGKSALALALARDFGGIVINADSMQVYRELAVVTARPTPEDEREAPHRLYGVLPAAEACSAARWREMALAEIGAATAEGRLPVVVGGTGLYLRALVEGLSPIPDIPEPVRAAARERMARLGAPAFHEDLARFDPAVAARLRPTDTQRLIRAWEVREATGRSLADWQAVPGEPPACRFATVVLMPPRGELYARIDRRFEAMIGQGALKEVAALDALGLDPSLPAMKAVGVPELRRHLAGEWTLEQAVEAAQQASRRYAKRQMTWLRHQLGATEDASSDRVVKFYDHFSPEIFPFIRRFLLTGVC